MGVPGRKWGVMGRRMMGWGMPRGWRMIARRMAMVVTAAPAKIMVVVVLREAPD